MSKNQSCQNFLEKFCKFVFIKWGPAAPEAAQGDPPCGQTPPGRGPALAAPRWRLEPTRPPTW